MSCYLRHMQDIFDEAGITVTKENRQQVDQAVHHVVDITYKDCPATWEKVKEDIRGDSEKRQAFIGRLKIAVDG